VTAKKSLELPKNLTDLFQYYDIVDLESRVNWRTEYERKEGSSSSRRQDALYSETFMFPECRNADDFAKDENAERLESLIKVLKFLIV
jgi:hypothetical protein